MQDNTNQQYNTAIQSCKEIFIKKTKDYGTSWRVYRTISVVDQIYIKAKRIRNIQEKKLQKIDDDLLSEFKGIVNYGVIGLIQLDLQTDETEDMEVNIVSTMYDEKISISKQLMEDKNHDYGEAWREMSQESFADLILAKV
ncbi:MAG: nucleotide modification associated domain-containing protein, partial [Chitinophagaceae bacterium]